MKLGVIGGTGIYQCVENLEETCTMNIDTPFGNPSETIIRGKMNKVELYFMPRHGIGHKILPGEINHKANIYAMKSLGVTHILSLSAVGSLKEEIKPRDVVIVDQFYDRTKRQGSDHTFFGGGIVGHISFGDPVCPELSKIVYNAACNATNSLSIDSKIHKRGTYVNMEGPAFSTKAESKVYRQLDMDVIGMTNLAEAKLSREAGICYTSAAFVTDYDCWHKEHGSVSVEKIIEHIKANTTNALEIIKETVAKMSELQGRCLCSEASKYAIVTDKTLIPEQKKLDLSVIFPQLIKDKE
jgi:5'-methylthioadenosine phosphorylase